MKKWTSLFTLALACAVLFAFAAAFADGGSDVLTISQVADAVSMDPHRTNDQNSANIMGQMYDTLVDLDADMNVIPKLATEWTQIDDLTWEFKLRQGVRFHNGEELKASDVKFTFDRHTNPETAAPAAFMLTTLESTEVVDDYTVRFHTKAPNAALLFNLTHVDMGILSEKAVTEAGDNYNDAPVGTGPFKFVSWAKNQQIVLERFDDYFLGAAPLSRLVFRIIPEGATSLAELMTGGVDIVLNLGTQYASQFVPGSGISLLKVPIFNVRYLSFDERQEPFGNPLVRQAINYAINRDALVAVAYSGSAAVANGVLNPAVHGAKADIEGYAYDPEKAKELLTEAGYPDGFASTLYVDTDEIQQRVATILQSQLAQVGIKIEIQTMEWGAFLEATAKGLPMFVLSWTTVTADADNGMYALFHSSAWGSSGNRSFYKNERVDELLDTARTEFDDAKRVAMYHEAQELIVADAPWAPLIMPQYLIGISDKVQGFVPTPTIFFKYYQVTKE